MLQESFCSYTATAYYYYYIFIITIIIITIIIIIIIIYATAYRKLKNNFRRYFIFLKTSF